MRTSRFLAAATVSLVLAAASGTASAGCLAGAAVGGIAGHVVGGHGLLGAAAGCAIGHHEANKHERERAHAAQAQAHADRVQAAHAEPYHQANGY